MKQKPKVVKATKENNGNVGESPADMNMARIAREIGTYFNNHISTKQLILWHLKCSDLMINYCLVLKKPYTFCE